MAGAGLLALLDDIAAVLDDVAVMTKLSAKRTAGVLTDDLAVNAEQVAGVSATREIPVVASVARGSFLNKLVIIPAILLIEHFAPWLMIILLLMGGSFLCYEGVHKILHARSAKKNTHAKEGTSSQISYSEEEIRKIEKQKIKGAIRTDFILSAEIMVIALSVVDEATLMTQILTLISLAVIITVGVYGFVAAIVKLDDIGFYMIKKSPEPKSLANLIGRGLVNTMPYLMKALGFIGTIAMFLVGGGIVVSEIPFLGSIQQEIINMITVGGFKSITPTLFNFGVGLIVGIVVAGIIAQMQSFKKAHSS